MKVYELIQQLTKFPPDMQVAATVIGERIIPLNTYADGSVDIDSFRREPGINVVPTKCGDFKCVRIEVDLV